MFRHQGASCPGGKIDVSPGLWSTLRVVVDKDQETSAIYLNDELAMNIKMLMPVRVSGGVVVANGWEDIVNFKNLNVVPQ